MLQVVNEELSASHTTTKPISGEVLLSGSRPGSGNATFQIIPDSAAAFAVTLEAAVTLIGEDTTYTSIGNFTEADDLLTTFPVSRGVGYRVKWTSGETVTVRLVG